MTEHHPDAAIDGAIDLAARRLGGLVLEATDEFFGPKESLLAPQPPAFDAVAYSDRGKVMDGWETRRRRDDARDSCVVRLGVPGVIATAVVDTTHFRGNAPDSCWLEGCVTDGGPPPPDATWVPLLDPTPVQPDSVQRFDLPTRVRVTHVRFGIAPDGGVARLRLLGRPLVDLHAAAFAGGYLDLAASVHGGRVVACSDAFFSAPTNLLMVGDARDMSDGWETRRRRGPGHDWVVVELATTGTLDRIEIDTTHFKGNHPDRCVVEGLHAPGAEVDELPPDGWVELVGSTPMQPHLRHVLAAADVGPVSHLRLVVVPDGGVARLRAFGTIDDSGWRRHGLDHLDAAPAAVAEADVLACCGSSAWARTLAARRPFADPEALFAAADEVWSGLDREDRLEAFGAHPRIGERVPGWASEEQAGTATADQATLDAFVEGNRVYEERFGHVFLIRAAGRSADEMLAALQERLDNDPDTEFDIASEQQREIMHLRLDRLLRDGRTG